MIKLTKANHSAGAGESLRLNIDHLIALQHQSPVAGKDFTAVIILGAPAFDAKETEEEIETLVYIARRKRANASMIFGIDSARKDKA